MARLDERVDDDGIELDARELAQFGQCLLVGQRGHPVGSGGRHRFEGISDVEDPGEPRDLVTDEPVGIAGAVVPLVVVADDRQFRAELRDRSDDLGAQDRMRVHDHPLVAVEAVLLEKDGIRDTDLADIVEQPAPFQRLELRTVDPHDHSDIDRDLLDPLAVPRRIRIALVDRLRQRPDRLREHVAHVHEPLGGQPRRVQRQCE